MADIYNSRLIEKDRTNIRNGEKKKVKKKEKLLNERRVRLR